jgi:hypothetical protein
MSKQKRKLTGIIAAFAENLKKNGYSAGSVGNYTRTARQFLKHIGTERIDRITEADTRAFFDRYKAVTRPHYAVRVSAFLNFATAGLPVVVNERGAEKPLVPSVTDRKELALRQAWALEQQALQNEQRENLIAQFGRQFVNHYLYFLERKKGTPENPDDILRFVSECQELIQNNLPLFMELSAKGLNVHTLINQRSQL